MDPMILGFDYRDLARHVADTRPERVTLGSLRVEPNLRRHLPAELLAPLAEPATTGAYARYPLATRVELYRSVLPYITPVCRAALCEETPDVWNAVGLDTAGARCNCGL
jgi:hypothetical protein